MKLQPINSVEPEKKQVEDNRAIIDVSFSATGGKIATPFDISKIGHEGENLLDRCIAMHLRIVPGELVSAKLVLIDENQPEPTEIKMTEVECLVRFE